METEDTAYVYKDLYAELENFEKNGVPMLIDGCKASPLQIVTAHMICEEGCYMRDYILDLKGDIESLTFVNVEDKKSGIESPHSAGQAGNTDE